MKVFHTSPEEITEIKNNGLFDDCLFFSAEEYAMGDVKAVYSLEISDNKIIEVSDLDDTDTIDHIANVLDCTQDQAAELLSGEIRNAGEITGDYEDDWFVQAQQGSAAKAMGFDACESFDEQGTVYIIPMMGRENDLVRVK